MSLNPPLQVNIDPTDLVKKSQKYIADPPPSLPQIDYWSHAREPTATKSNFRKRLILSLLALPVIAPFFGYSDVKNNARKLRQILSRIITRNRYKEELIWWF